jgi:hypothetical protein
MLEFTLELNPAAEAASQSPQATFTLTNTGPDSVVVNRRLTLNNRHEIEECREIDVHILDQAEIQVPFTAWLRVPELTNADFAPLAPGESIKQTYRLQDYYTLAHPGTYSIQAFYENVFNPTTGEAWKGKLESNVVKFNL